MEDCAADQEHITRNLVLSVVELTQNGESPGNRVCAASVTIGTRLYFFGGADACSCSNDLHLLEIEQMKWSYLPTTGAQPSPRYGHCMFSIDQKLVVLGGLPSSGATSSDIGTAPFLDPARAGPVWNHIHRSPDACFAVLDTNTMEWTAQQTPMPARCFHSTVICANKVLVYGGAGDDLVPLNDLWSYDIPSQSWTCIDDGSCAGNPGPRFGHQGCYVAKDDVMYLFGGHNDDDNLYSFSLATNAWSLVEVVGTPPRARKFHSVDLIGHRIFVFAGLTSSDVADLYILDTNTNRWARPLYEGQLNVRGQASAILHDKLIVFGGVREKECKKGVMEQKISKKLFFLNVLEIKDSVSEGDFKFKLVTIGDSGVGKSCLLTRFVQDYYSDFHVSTIGVDFKTVVTMVKGRLVKLQLWDTAGQERFSVVTGNYYRNSDGFVFVYDATNRTSFEHVDQWIEQVKQHHECGSNTIKVLAGNKCDCPNPEVRESEGRAKAEEIGALFVPTSAKTAHNVDMAFLLAAQKLVEMRRTMQAKNAPSGISLSSARPNPQQKSTQERCCGQLGMS